MRPASAPRADLVEPEPAPERDDPTPARFRAPWTRSAIRSVARGRGGRARARKVEPAVDAVDTETEDGLGAVPADRARRGPAPRRHAASAPERGPCRQ